jgi:hypothetical protein
MMRIDRTGDTIGKVSYRIKHVHLPCRETGLTLCYTDLFKDKPDGTTTYTRFPWYIPTVEQAMSMHSNSEKRYAFR